MRPNKLAAMRRPGESLSDVIIRLAAGTSAIGLRAKAGER
jgi:hypothetical protein